MKVDSYLELVLTLFAFDVANKLATVLVGTGLIFIPVAWLFWKNWQDPARSQEAKAAAPVSLRRMEQDIGLALLAMLLAFLPAINISSSDITYTSPINQTSIDANTVNIESASSPVEGVRVPVLWWIVIQFSSAFTDVFKTAIHSFESPQFYRVMALTVDYAQLSTPALIKDLQQFDRNCYIPALTAREEEFSNNNRFADRRWRGSDTWMQAQGYYDSLRPHPPLIPNGWENQYSHPDNPGPTCSRWWSERNIGIRDRLYDEITAIKDQEREAMDAGAFVLGPTSNRWPRNPTGEYKDDVVQTFLDRKGPKVNSKSGSGSVGGETNALFSALAAIGSVVTYPLIKTTMTALIIALPMVQAMILACIYIALPIAVPFAVLRPGVLVFFVSAIFSVKFLTGIWALANFIDEKLISMMYGGKGIFAGSGTPSDVLLWFVALLSYAGLPVVWLWLMASFSGNAISGANSLFKHTLPQITGGVQSGMKTSSNLLGKISPFK